MAGRLLAVSDLHVGYPDNRAYADALSPGDPGDWLIVAGDVGEVFADVGFVLASLANRFAKVIWTPGNHELWTLPSDPVALRGAARYEALVKVCRRFGVLTPEDEFPVWDGPDGPVTVAPLFTLYDYSFHGGQATTVPATEGPADAILADIDGALNDDGRPAALAAARRAGIKPVDEGRLYADPYPSAAAWCRDLVAAADRRLAAVDGPVVLVSHWPLVRDPVAALRHQEFAPWCGTTRTADWHIRHQVVAAVYGHLHIPRSARYDGVRFEEVSVGYPREWQRRGTAPPGPRVILAGLPASPLYTAGYPGNAWTMDFEHILVERSGDFATVTMNRPQRRNALSLPHMRELIAAFRDLGDSDTLGIVLAGNGPVFSAGHDFADVAGADLTRVRSLLNTCTELMTLIQQVPQPVVARVHGLATAAGCQLVASADLAVASEDAGFAAPGGKGGWFCHTPMVAVARNVGRKRAMELALSGDVIDARTALDWGLVNRVVPADRLDDAVGDLLERTTRGSAISKGIGKQALYAQIDLDQPKAYAYAVEVMASTSQLPDAQEGMRAFLEKRKPRWRRGR
jgi:enoyl-CoA hydratase/carnithine racemase/3',5'-cyclic AMP phosphodiesterase CpdA